ncbi:hypothetical protein PENTCL1PPCAC_20152, partial [Pristionchus entomophagus]
KKDSEARSTSSSRTLTCSMIRKRLSDIPDLPMGMIFNRLITKTGYGALANVGKTCRHWKSTVDAFLARRSNLHINRIALDTMGRKGGLNVLVFIPEDNVSLHPFANLRKSVVKRFPHVESDGQRFTLLTIRITNSRDAIIDQLAKGIDTVETLDISGVEDTMDPSKIIRLMKNAKVEKLSCETHFRMMIVQTSRSIRFSRRCRVCLVTNPRYRVAFIACGHASCLACAQSLPRARGHADGDGERRLINRLQANEKNEICMEKIPFTIS